MGRITTGINGGDGSEREHPPPATVSLREQRLEKVIAAFTSLPERFLGADENFDATFQVRLGDVGRTWQIRVRPDRCRVRPSPTREPDVVIGTDSGTWLALRSGRLSGLDAFARRRLYARGDLDLALAFEGLFRLPGGRPPLLRSHRVDIGSATISALVAGDGPEHVVCVHGLGSNKVSFFETVSALTPDYTVHAIDLPGFGSSSKPARAPYDACWFAGSLSRYMDAAEVPRAHLVGNSLGGRVVLEMALREPIRVATVSLLAPALAFRRHRELAPLVRLLRPELASIPHPLGADRVRAQLWGMFANPDRLDPAAADVAADEFLRAYRSRAGRVAFFAALRSIYLDTPYGDRGLWTRLADLSPPALFVWGDSDRLVPARFSRHIAAVLPDARQAVLAKCGHVPQVELPDRTNAMIRELIGSTAGAARPGEEPRIAAATPDAGLRSRARALLGRVAL